MSSARESGLWDWLKGATPDLRRTLHMCRVENSTMRGMPDVEGHLIGYGQFWIELKSAARPAGAGTPVRFHVRDREAQVAWLSKRWWVGGSAWLLLQVGTGAGRRLYLVAGKHAGEVYSGADEGRLRELDELQEPKPRPSDVVRRAARDPRRGIN